MKLAVRDAALSCALLAACVDEPASKLGERDEAIVYDADDRVEAYEHESTALRALVNEAVVALVPNANVAEALDGSVTLEGKTLAETRNLCAGERFAEQPSIARCSGVLIARDLVLTASHCLRQGFGTTLDCEQYAYVFSYAYAGEGRLQAVSAPDVYGCRRVLPIARDDLETAELALVQLDRPVAPPRRPAPLRVRNIAVGERVAVLGFPSGLPAKIDSGGHVLTADAKRGAFSLDSDTFEGSSGSGIFDLDGRLAGALLAGGQDFEQADSDCATTRVLSRALADVPAESALYVQSALQAACDRGAIEGNVCTGLAAPTERPPSACSIAHRSALPLSSVGSIVVAALSAAGVWRRRQVSWRVATRPRTTS